VDGFVVSHNDIDHSGGMVSVLVLMHVAWLASSLPEDADIPIAQKKIQCFTGQNWTWDDVRFEISHPSAESYEMTRLKIMTVAVCLK
jgi:competence protein ComEC